MANKAHWVDTENGRIIRTFANAGTARRSLGLARQKEGAKRYPSDLYNRITVVDVDQFVEDGWDAFSVEMVPTVNALTGKTVMIERCLKGTECDPARESYHSM